MSREQKNLVISVISAISFLVIALLCISFFTSNPSNPFDSWTQKISDWRGSFQTTKPNEELLVEEEEEEKEPLMFKLRRLVRGDNRIELEKTGLSCHFDTHSESCVVSKPVRIDAFTIRTSSDSDQHMNKTIVKPYARREDDTAMKNTKPIEIVSENTVSPPCNFSHNVPALVFSSGGFTGNIFHEFNEIIIPLFITSYHFKSEIQFVITDFNPRWVKKFSTTLSQLSSYEIINPEAYRNTHCFPAAVVGLKYHDNLALNDTQIPGGYSMFDFRQFLKRAYNLKLKSPTDAETRKPKLLIVSRKKTRRFLNENEIVNMTEKLGFEVVVITENKMSNLDKFAEVVNSCSVMVGVHGAGLTNELFLPNGAVIVQVVPLGLGWASKRYFGDPGIEMGLKYLEYKIEPEESSLIDKYRRDDPVFSDPWSVYLQGYYVFRSTYVDGQDVRVNITRFRKTLVEAMQLIRHSVPRD